MRIIRNISLLFVCAMTLVGTKAALRPIVSTDGNEVWYMIQFLNGQNVVTAMGDGNQVKTQVPTGKRSQWWKLTGDAESGFTLTSKTGLTLTCSTNQKEGMFYATSSPSANILFKLISSTNAQYNGEWMISPSNNTGVFMNQWGGAGSNKQLGLWNARNDANQPLKFVSETEFNTDGQPLPLIPYPQSVIRGEGTLKVADIKAVYAKSEASKRAVKTFVANLAKVSGNEQLTIHDKEVDGCCFNLIEDPSIEAEGYTLKASNGQIYIKASAYAGFFYALQSLRQLLPPTIYGQSVDPTFSEWTLPEVEITDSPLMSYRGFHLDVSRHFFTVDEVKKLLHTAAQYKFNRFHWHLTDDQGWRIEIPEYPLLTEVGSVRKGSFTLNAVNGTKFIDDTEYGRGCFYTLQQLKDIVAYAKELNIEIMPEIDLPGHMMAAIAAYPEFSCDPSKKYEVRIDGGISHDVLNIGDDKTIDFLKTILGHVATIFPYQYIHLGGDECPTDNWRNNTDCLNRVRDEGLGGVDELQSWLVEELGIWLKDNYQKDIVVWDELLSHWSDNNTIKPVIMAWNGTGFTAAAANRGMKSIHVPYQYLYLDFQQVPNDQMMIDEPYNGGWGVNTIDKIYNFDPLMGMHDRSDYVMGAQGNLWTETCSSIREAEYQYYPRLLALSEINWLPNEKKSWMSFYQRMQQNVKALNVQQVTYAKHYIEQPELTRNEALRQEAEQLIVTTQPDQPGYASTQTVNALKDALNNPDADLEQAIAHFKQAKVCQPNANTIYRIVSASTATAYRYNGSTVYAKGEQLAIHYTGQSEPEELWQFVPQADGSYIITQAISKQQLEMKDGATTATLSNNGTPIVLGQPTPNGGYTYMAGVVTLRTPANEDVRLLTANPNGILSSDGPDKLCQRATWRLEEVSDYRLFLKKLVIKCQREVDSAQPTQYGQPSIDALEFLTNKVITPASAIVDDASISVNKQTYMEFADFYDQFCNMPRTSLLDSFDEDVYYRIRNVYFNTNVARLNNAGLYVTPSTTIDGDAALWQIVKLPNGKICLINKAADNKYVGINASAQDEKVRTLNTPYAWTLEEITTDVPQTGIAIVDATGTYSWYTNPSAFTNIQLRPKTYGGSIWSFEPTTERVITAVNETALTPLKGNTDKIYDLSGRPVTSTYRGYIIRNERITIQRSSQE